jgi:hypothetical protein
MVKVVVAHYNENLDWTKQLKYETIIISKCGISQDVFPNKGNEASSYLQYIIDHYDNLDDITIFVHGHQFAWHHKSDIVPKINNIEFIHDYYNINEIQLEKLDNAVGPGSDCDSILYDTWKNFINETGIVVDYINLHCRCSAQFYVKKELIRNRSKAEYIIMYNWLKNTNITSFWTGRVFEHSWHYLFTSNLIDIL